MKSKSVVVPVLQGAREVKLGYLRERVVVLSRAATVNFRIQYTSKVAKSSKKDHQVTCSAQFGKPKHEAKSGKMGSRVERRRERGRTGDWVFWSRSHFGAFLLLSSSSSALPANSCTPDYVVIGLKKEPSDILSRICSRYPRFPTARRSSQSQESSLATGSA